MNGLVFVPVFLLALADWVSVARRNKNAEYFFKPAVMAALIATAFQIGGDAPDRQLYATVAALGFSLIGDVFLMLPRDFFLQGLSAFFIAHICYIVALLQWPWGSKTWAIAIALLVVAIPLFRMLRRGMVQRQRTEMIVPVLAYCVAITAMVVAAASFAFDSSGVVGGVAALHAVDLTRSIPDGARVAAIAGALLFYSSDLMIGIDRFVTGGRGSGVAIIVTYHLGQIGLVAALFR